MWGGVTDNQYVRLQFEVLMGYKPNLENPRTFAEKLQWLKLNVHEDIFTQMVDKYGAKDFITERVGREFTIPTIAVYDKVSEIDLDKLPEQFIIKTTHDSGTFFICRDKRNFDINKVKRALKKSLRRKYYYYEREWPYKNVKPRIIVEELLNKNGEELHDYKFYCFNGEPKIFYITSDKGGNLPTRQDFFDIEGRHLDIEDIHYTNNPVKCPELPTNLSKMVEMAKKLAKDTYHLRVDLYEVNNKIYVGELTFYEAGGYCAFKPDKWNYTLGDWIKLPIDQ